MKYFAINEKADEKALTWMKLQKEAIAWKGIYKERERGRARERYARKEEKTKGDEISK